LSVLARSLAGPATKCAMERGRLREAEQERHLLQREPRLGEKRKRELVAGSIELSGEGRPFSRKLALKAARTSREATRHLA
jgi:hypothetical protein